ncbi:NrtR DNA-binding winged helix domain-containing protein [Dyadobacter sp. CY326]|uniref:NUDIX hydrolase n=1 Tax=Dyadobacter sp. CY326 TaxID=2907300 RepID=UPI001F29390C|nr:NUDIX domain-containing protein [Dyadobacter sp. CY326]MCE7064968.1 NUDIX domain-containing protein [Dyadobacter sp. CY326]
MLTESPIPDKNVSTPILTNPSEQNYIDQLSIDCVIFGYHNKALKVLVPKLNFKGDFWGVPGGFVHQHEDIDDAAHRILQTRTGIKEIYLEQFHVFGNAARNNLKFMKRLLKLNPELLIMDEEHKKEYMWLTKRFVSIGYYALVDINKVIPQKIDIDESIDWYNVQELPELIIDHNEIVEKALSALRASFDEKLIAFNLLPETFTMKDVQELYETIFDKPLARNNFQKKILDMNVLERLEKKFTGAANKAPYLYRFKR